MLSPDEFKRFSEYRKRRKEIAEADGVKPFVVMTDAQMAELAKMENPTKEDLVTFLPEDLKEPEEPSELEKELDGLLEGLPTTGEETATVTEETEVITEKTETVAEE